MDWQTLFNIMVGLCGVFGGWILNDISRSIRTLDQDVRNMPHTYVTKDQYRDDIADVKNMLGKIFDKLDGKVDK